jgi:hypothetical protein
MTGSSKTISMKRTLILTATQVITRSLKKSGPHVVEKSQRPQKEMNRIIERELVASVRISLQNHFLHRIDSLTQLFFES